MAKEAKCFLRRLLFRGTRFELMAQGFFILFVKTCGLLTKSLLNAVRSLSVGGDSLVNAFRVEFPGVDVVLEVILKKLYEGLFNARVDYRKKNFHAAIKVARHPIRTGQIDFFKPVVFKIEDAGMLQKHIHDADDFDVVA